MYLCRDVSVLNLGGNTYESMNMYATCMNHVTVGRQFWTKINPAAQWSGNYGSLYNKKMSHSSKFLPPFSSLHYLAHSTEGLIIESGHPVEGTTILFSTQQETQESSLVPPFSSFCLHPVLQAGWSILLEISLDSVTCIMPPTARSKDNLGCPHIPTVALTTTLYPLFPSMFSTQWKQS